MFDIPIVYSVFKRHKIVEQNLNLFKELGISNVYFLLDASPTIDTDNLRCIKLVKDFCNQYGSLCYSKSINFGIHCLVIDFYKEISTSWLKDYHILLEDDFLVTKEFFEFHNIYYRIFKGYGAIIPFGFNVNIEEFKVFEINPSSINGCMWGGGFDSEDAKLFFTKEFYNVFKEDYLDVSYLKYLSSRNKKLLITSSNLLSYRGFNDSRDRERLSVCSSYPQFFEYNKSFNKNFIMDNSLSKEYLIRHQFYVNDCKECI